MLTAKRFVVYYPVSVEEDDAEAAERGRLRRAVESYIGEKGPVLKEFSEKDGSDELPELTKAMAYTEKRKGVLVIPELTFSEESARLLQRLKNSAVKYHFVVMPDSNLLMQWLMNDVFPKVTREERSQRTRAAMQAAKERGANLGTPENLTPEAQKLGVRVRQENARNDESNRQAASYCAGYKLEGKSFAWIADRLNEMGLTTRRGERWTKGNLYRVWCAYEEEMKPEIESLARVTEEGKRRAQKKGE